MPDRADPEALYQRALQAEPATAIALLQSLLQKHPEHPNVAYRLGMLLHQRGEAPAAELAYRRELSQRQAFWACRANLAQLLAESGRYAEAMSEAQVALDDCPQPEARADLLQLQGRLHRVLQAPQAALQCLQQAQEIADSADLQRDYARLLLQLGQTGAAARHYRQALRLNPSLRLRREIGEHLISVQQFPEAIGVLEEVLASGRLAPSEAAIVTGQIANAWQELNQPQRALDTYQAALELARRDSLELARALVLPVVYRDPGEVVVWRHRLEHALGALRPLRLEDPLELGVLPFYAPYQGYNEKPLMEAFAASFRRSLPPGPSMPARRATGRALRVGCISHFFYDHSVMRCFADLLLELNHPPFELHLIAASPLLSDRLTQELSEGASSWTHLHGNLPAQLEQIRRLELDICLFTDTGLDPHSYLLAQYRHAPLQLLLPGQPVTSGLSSFTGFLSDQHSEPADAASHYTEPLIRLSQLPSIYRPPRLPARFLSREALGLPDARLHLCPAQAFKLHPEMDPALLGILRTDPAAMLILLDLTPNGLMRQVQQRLQAQLPERLRPRVLLLPRLDPTGFSSLLAAVDVVLESFPFSSYNTLMAAFAVGTPVVTLPGRFLRGRYCLGLYRQMGLESAPIADSIGEYAAFAVRIAQESRYRQRLQAQILAARPKIFDNRAVSQELRDLLLELAKR